MKNLIFLEVFWWDWLTADDKPPIAEHLGVSINT